MKTVFQTSKSDNRAVHSPEFVAIDVSWLAHRHAHATGTRLATQDGRMSGHIYGAFKDFRGILTSLRPNNVVFCYDRGYSWRSKLVPSYKAHRHAKVQDKWTPAPDVERLFRCFPGTHLSFPDMEADDMIGWAAQNLEREGSLVIYSKDRDLWQLVSKENQVAVMFPKKDGPRTKSKPFWVDEAVVKKEFGVPPHSLAKVKALLGDPSDGIKGLTGGKKPGKKRALAEFAESEASEEYFAGDPNVELTVPDFLEEPLRKEQKRIIDNYRVTNIPYALSRIKGDTREDTKADLSAALEVLAEFECHSLLAQVEPFFKRLNQ